MEQKINIAELLKDCPKGMELECTMYNNVILLSVDDKKHIFPIRLLRSDGCIITLTKYGQYTYTRDAKCVIFPKGKTTWEGFVPPCKFKDGDVVFYNDTIAIFKEWGDKTLFRTYVAKYLCCDSLIDMNVPLFGKSVRKEIRLATEEEKQKLFQAIKDNGYKWNAETKTLDKLVESHTFEKFYIRIGDIPSEERSAVHRGDAVVGYEDGVSVYDCVKIDGLYRIIMPFPLKEGQGMTYETLIQEITQCRYEIENPRNVYLVSGIEVGKGHDNEPLIKEVKVLKDLTGQFNTKSDNIEETKTLEKLVEPKFKVGDRIRLKENHTYIYTITGIREKENKYECGVTFVLRFSEHDNWELVPNKFDINTLKPFDKVLVRDFDKEMWRASLFSHTWKDKHYCTGAWYKQCIPYEHNEYLLGTTNGCDKFYKTW